MEKKICLTLLILVSILVAHAAFAQSTCDKYGTITVANGEYKLANNEWGSDARQCIQSTGGTGFKVTTSELNQNSVGSFPSIYKGCHWGDCTTNSGLPIQVSQIGSCSVNFSVSSARPSGKYDVMSEGWFSPSSDSSGGYNGGAELLIALDYCGGMTWAGSQVGTFNGYNVYYSNVGWNFVQYVKTGQSSQSINVKDFINDMISRGYIQSSWYFHVWEAGFEIMSGGAGLTANSFSFSVSGGGSGGATNPPSATPAPTNPPSGGNCGTCNWYGTNYPLCCTTTSGWGWENNQSCISQSTCNTQGGGSGTVTPAPTNPPSGGGTVTPAPTNPPSGGGGSASGCTCPVGCGSQVAISSSYSKDGAGESCLVASSLGSYLNSWNLDSLIVNGANCTNKYTSVSSIPKNSDGKYYIYYKASFSWSHFEAR